MTDYPAITLWQPWATLVAEGMKPFEFRHWPAPQIYRGKRVAIHAGSRPARRGEIADLILQLCNPITAAETGLVRHDEARRLLERAHTSPGCLPLSSILCLATLGEPIRNAELAAKLGLPWTNDSSRDEHSNWGWPLTDIEPLRPFVPARGAQGWWTFHRPDNDSGA